MHRVSSAVAPKRFHLGWLVLSFAMALQLLSVELWAAHITVVQGKKALLDLNGDSATEGDLFIAMSPEGKKLGIIRLQKVRGGKAIGQIVKGRAEKNWEAVARGKTSARATSKKPTKSSRVKFSDFAVGGMGGFSMDSQNVTIAGNKVTMSGMGFSGVAFGDYHFTESLSARAVAGVDTFNTAGSINLALCANTTDCATNLMYFNFGGLARWSFITGPFSVWIGGGVYFLYPVTKSSNAIKEDSITFTYTMTAAAGGDIQISPTMYIPVQLEYGLFPKTEDVETTWMAARAGLGWRF